MLFSGHHGQIAAWRRERALELTRERRPDLLPAPRRREILIVPAVAADAGELLTLQRAAYVSEGRLHDSFDFPPLTDDLAAVEAAHRRPPPAWSPVAADGWSDPCSAADKTTTAGSSAG